MTTKSNKKAQERYKAYTMLMRSVNPKKKSKKDPHNYTHGGLTPHEHRYTPSLSTYDGSRE